MTRNQIRRREYVINRRLREFYVLFYKAHSHSSAPDADPQQFDRQVQQAQAEVELLNKELQELSTKMLESCDEDEPQEEIYLPTSVTEIAPMLILLHGAGWTGGSQVEIWRAIAETEKIVLMAPTSISIQRDWTHRDDYQSLIMKFRDALTSMPIDASRIYLVGHSLGGAQALRMGLINSNRIAALALHSPTPDYAIRQEKFAHSTRRLPIRVWVGSDHVRDSNRTWAEVLQMHYRDRPELANVDVDIMFLEDHDHKDYNTREGLLEEMWSFLKDKSLLRP